MSLSLFFPLTLSLPLPLSVSLFLCLSLCSLLLFSFLFFVHFPLSFLKISYTVFNSSQNTNLTVKVDGTTLMKPAQLMNT